MIKATAGLVGTPGDWEQIGSMETVGLKEILLLPPVHCARENFREFADNVMPAR